MGAKILVFDSDQESLVRTRRMLQEAGYNVTAVGDGFLCLQTFEQEGDFAAVLLNEGQEGALSGLDVLQRIKDISPDTPVVMSSTSWTPESLQDCTGVGAFFCVEKAAGSDHLLLKVLAQAVEEHRLSLSKGKSV